jgi:hypothetical protein
LTLVKSTRADSGERVLTQSSLLVSILGILTFRSGYEWQGNLPPGRYMENVIAPEIITNTQAHRVTCFTASVGLTAAQTASWFYMQRLLHRRYHARQALSLMLTASGSVDWNCRLCLCQASSSSRPASPSLTASVQRLGPAATERRVRRIHSL